MTKSVNLQSKRVCSDKNCQETNMWPVKPIPKRVQKIVQGPNLQINKMLQDDISPTEETENTAQLVK